MKKIVALLLTAAALCSGILAAPALARAALPEVELITMQEFTYEEAFYVSGVVESPKEQRMELDLPVVPSQVLVEEGDYVEYGQLLAVLDPAATEKALLSLAGEYAGFIPEEILPGLQAAFAAADPKLPSGGFPLELRSTMNGILTAMNLREGQLFLPTSPAAAVSSANYLRVRLFVPEAEAGALSRCTRLTFTASAVEGGLFAARISRIGAEAVKRLDGLSYETVVEAVADIEEDFGVLRPGYTVRAAIPRGEPEVLRLLPYEAVLQDDSGQEYVYVYQEGAVSRRDIRTGEELSTSLAVTYGLSPYEKVVYQAGALKGEGPVRVREGGEH